MTPTFLHMTGRVKKRKEERRKSAKEEEGKGFRMRRKWLSYLHSFYTPNIVSTKSNNK